MLGEPTFSPDGKWMWNGAEWIPAPPTHPPPRNTQPPPIPAPTSANLAPSIHFKKTTWAGAWDLKWPSFFEKHEIPGIFEEIGSMAGVQFQPCGLPATVIGTRMTTGDIDVTIVAGRRKCCFQVGGRKRRGAKWLIPIIGQILVGIDTKNDLKRNMELAEKLASAIESLLPPKN